MSQKIIVDTTPGFRMPTIFFSQGDVGRTFQIDLASRFGDSLPDSPTVKIMATKPSGFGFTVTADSLTGTVAQFTTTEGMTDEAGRFPAEVQISKNSVVYYTANFVIACEENTHPEGTIDGQADQVIPELTVLVERAETAASSVLDRQTVTTTLAAGAQATYTFDEETNTQTFGIPQGEAGAGAAGVTASAYSSSSTYAVGDYVIHNSNLYRCTTAITTAESFTAAHWTQVVLGDDVSDLKSEISDMTDGVKTLAIFNGSSSVCSVDAITLSEDGDVFEIEVFPEVSTDAYGYSFASNANKANISIGATTKGVAFRAFDGTWLYLGNTAFASEKYHYVIKIEYASGDINFYVDGTLLSTYTGQKTIKIEGFGKNNYWSYWKGKIGYIKINDDTYKNVSELSGYTAVDVSVIYPYGLLSEEQYVSVESLEQSKLIVSPSSNKVSVYTHLSGVLWGRFDIGYEANHADDPYVDYWRINESALCVRNDDGTFTATANKLIIGAENEMALSFSGMGDFTGGYHGDERIDLDNDCYVAFIVDGEEYSISALVALGTVKCDTFAYREVSQLFASYSYNTAHLPIAKHTKITRFENKGFVTTNYVGIDLTGFNQNTIRIIQPFTGLFCIASAFASVAVSDIGTEYTAVHPVSTTTLAEEMNIYSLWAKTFKNNYSCEMDSSLLHTNINAYKNPPIDVDMMDRQTDLKYYSYLPINTDVVTDDYFATEAKISFNIHG